MIAAAPDQVDAPSPSIRTHLGILIVALAVLVASASLRIAGPRDVRLPGTNVSLPELCYWHRMTGYDCPGCGLTRSFIATTQGRIARAWRYHPMGTLLFGVVVAQIPFRILQVLRLRRGKPAVRIGGVSYLAMVVALLMLVQWIVRLRY